MKKSLILVTSILLVLTFNTASAGCFGSVVNGACIGTEVDDSESTDYQGSSGARYQYDMSDPSDRTEYSVDLDAQRRDQMSVDPGRSIDRGIGQYGGGVYDD